MGAEDPQPAPKQEGREAMLDQLSRDNPAPELTLAANDEAGSTSIRAGLATVGGVLAAVRVGIFRRFAHQIVAYVVGTLRALLPMTVVLLIVAVLAFRLTLP